MTSTCPVCGSGRWNPRFKTEIVTVDPQSIRPTADHYGTTVGQVVACADCTHLWVINPPPVEILTEAYGDAEDPVSVREESGQIATAHRDLQWIEQHVKPGRVLDLGCWTGSFLAAARERGWDPVGVEPSEWASARARQRGLDVRTVALDSHGLDPGSFRLVTMLDVIEHLVDPSAALKLVAALLEPGGVLFVTTPDAGSGMARTFGRRWWSVLPMHVQYFTRTSLLELLERHGFEIQDIRTHAKVFTVRYYAERLSGYSAALGRAAVSSVSRIGLAGRHVQPNFRDRTAVIAVPRQ